MFANFIYFIIAVLIYATYQPSEASGFSLYESGGLFLFMLILFSGFTWQQFHSLRQRLDRDSLFKIDQKFTSLITRQSILAVLLFAVEIYGLNLSSFFLNHALLIYFPTGVALLFVFLFIFHLGIVWACAHPLYCVLYQSKISRRSYVFSNISFGMPVLLPWVLLSGIADIIRLLPFEFLKEMLATTEGEIVYFLVFLFVVAIVGPSMIQKFWRCRPLEAGPQRSQIETLCRTAALEYRDILHWPIFEGRMITAGVMGLVKRFRYILVTRALLHLLEPIEIDAVIAHEIGHIQKKHLVFYLFFFMGYMLVSFALFDLIVYVMIYLNPVMEWLSTLGVRHETALSAIFSLLIIIMFLIYFRFIFGYFMRNFERQADIHVYAVLGSAAPLISTLQKIARTSRQSADKPNWHHYSIRERIDYLIKCESNRSWISRHNRKVNKSILVYAVSILLLGGIGYQLNYGDAGRVLNARFFEKVITREIQRMPDNADLYTTLGDLQYQRRDFAAAIRGYEQAVRLDEAHARALNNLAWLYATCEEKELRRPEKALTLAKKASRTSQEAHILDTLAESYFINGRLQEALDTSIKAREGARDNLSYYDNQIRRFQEALAKE